MEMEMKTGTDLIPSLVWKDYKDGTRRLLVLIDLQNDFFSGSLGSDYAISLIPRITEKIKNWEGDIACTLDTHDENYLKTREGKFLPIPHCKKGDWGWEIEPTIMKALQERIKEGKKVIFIEKNTFGSVDLPAIVREGNYDYIELEGLVSEICDVSNAIILKAHFPETEIAVDEACCAGVTRAMHKAAMNVMKSCQIVILNETPSIAEEKGCVGCKYEGISHNNYPCCDCSRSSKDYYLKEVH